MTDILDQNDVDALLQAVTNPKGAVQEIMTSDSGMVEKEVTVYDFKRPERVSKDQMRALEGIHAGFARNFGASLSAFLRTIVEVRIADTEQLTYGEFIHSLPNPTCFNLITVKPLDGSICLELSPLIIYPIIDRLLGGTKVDVFVPQRPLTTIEQRLVGRIIERALKLLTDAWSSLDVEGFELGQVESNPHLVQVVAPNEVAVVITFELKLANKSGTMSLCVPFTTIEPLLDKLATQNWLSYRRKDSDVDHTSRVVDNVRGAVVNMRAVLAETKISMGELMNLEVGDYIQTEKLANLPVVLDVEGRGKFAGRPAQYRGNRAIKVLRKLTPDDRL